MHRRKSKCRLYSTDTSYNSVCFVILHIDKYQSSIQRSSYYERQDSLCYLSSRWRMYVLWTSNCKLDQKWKQKCVLTLLILWRVLPSFVVYSPCSALITIPFFFSSAGDYYQKGKQRKQELWNSCTTLGIPESNIFLQRWDKYFPNVVGFIWIFQVVWHFQD